MNDLALDVVMEAPPPRPVLHHDLSLVLCVNEEGRGLHLGEGELEVVVEIVQVEEEISDASAKLAQHLLVADINGQLDEVSAHPLVKLLVF